MNAVGVKKDANETIDRHHINQIKQKLKEKFRHQAFSATDLRNIASGQSELTLLIEDWHLKEVHINLIYALIELFQEEQLDIVDRYSLQFRMKS
ncbi:hypothetical protein NIES2104_23470 [Leptolyngbya sp. NIES-2104]|nr:hypothetical protein NIES2104_23470 [Leptolyngbya sp. NIES-2104]